MIQFDKVSLEFSKSYIFQNLSFQIKSGEHVCLSGASGKGKSSILKLLQGFIKLNQGNIKVNSMELSDLSIQEIREFIIWIPQNVNLSVNSGQELIELLELNHEINKIESYLNRLGLNKDILKQDFREVSGGQKQRIVISLCFAMDRDITLMDEPTSSLDDSSTESLIQLVNSMKDKTILSASHNLLWVNNAQQIINL